VLLLYGVRTASCMYVSDKNEIKPDIISNMAKLVLFSLRLTVARDVTIYTVNSGTLIHIYTERDCEM
jgi:hypothetical protein